MNLTRIAGWALALATVVVHSGCGGGGGGGVGGTGATTGTLSVSMTDAPSCGFDAVNVTVEKVRVHQGATLGDDDAGWSEIVVNPPRRIDLLTLTNGALEPLGQTVLPAGTYTQLRLVLASNSPADPLANSVIPTGGVETPLTTPSGQQSGLKLNTNLNVPAGDVVDIALDFDACKSVVRRGATGSYNLKPVISVIPLVSDAGLRVAGYVDPSMTAATTMVSVQVNGVPVKATPPDSTGRFLLYPLPAAQYDLVVTAAGRATTVMTGVPVVAGAPTTVSSPALPINPPAATARTVTGTVSPATATVRVLQGFSGGPSVETHWVPVDGQTGVFSVDLPIGAPVRAVYAPSAALLTFTPDAPAAGRFSVDATSSGAAQTRAIDVNAPVAPLSFVFP